VYNAATRRYVLWFNGNDVASSYHVMTSRSPSGPFRELDEPDAQRVAVNADGQLRVPNNGDPSMFVDDDGTGYLSYTDWRRGGDLIVERLNTSYTRGTGDYVRLGMTHVEAPALFKRGHTYYLTYSDPNCGLCSGTGTSARSSASPLGPWSEPIKLSDDSCGGQPSHVTRVIDQRGAETFIYQSDLWDPDGKGDQRRANHYWGPLEFAGEALRPIRCLRDFSVPVLHDLGKRRWLRGWQSERTAERAKPVSYRPNRGQL
jgi:beta-xylosidase